ncbi:MAG: hypothetical protein QMC79_02505 [Anaerosomatales bacterium]|nr:hypothetical protein [Anaerosomatales bacterium]
MDDAQRVDTTRRSPLGQAFIALAAVLGAVLVLLALAHVFIRPIAPGQAPPAGHFGEPCIACHFVSDGADTIDVDE